MRIDHGQLEALMREALAEAERGLKSGEAPIGCVIAYGDPPQIVARDHNRFNATKRRTAHAEMLAFERTGGDPPALPEDAQDVVLVSTLEPCVMCTGAAMEAGVALIVYGMHAPADNGMQRVSPPFSPEASNPTVIGGVLAKESRDLFERFLKKAKDAKQRQFTEQLLSLTDEEGKDAPYLEGARR